MQYLALPAISESISDRYQLSPRTVQYTLRCALTAPPAISESITDRYQPSLKAVKRTLRCASTAPPAISESISDRYQLSPRTVQYTLRCASTAPPAISESITDRYQLSPRTVQYTLRCASTAPPAISESITDRYQPSLRAVQYTLRCASTAPPATSESITDRYQPSPKESFTMDKEMSQPTSPPISSKRKRSASLGSAPGSLSPPQTRRRTQAVAALADDTSMPPPATFTSSQAFTNLSIDTEQSENQKEIDLAAARASINTYESAKRGENEDLVKPALNAFLDWLPPSGRENIVNDINRATLEAGDHGIYDVFSNLYTGIRCRMAAKSKPPTISESPSDRATRNTEKIFSQLDDPARRQKEFRDGLIERDSLRCVVTGALDIKEYLRLQQPRNERFFGELEAAHIIPFSYGSWNDSNSACKEVAKAWEVLLKCFPSIQEVGFSNSDINQLSNGMMLRPAVHSKFRRFAFAFKATDIRHTYNIETFEPLDESERLQFPENVDFRGRKCSDDLLPKPELLECHWRLAKILHASGMSEAFEKDMQDWEELKCLHQLRPDGQTDIERFLQCHTDLWAYPCAQEA